MWGKRDDSITHLIAECKKLALKEYKQRHDNIARIVHLEPCQVFGLVGEVKWYNNKPTGVVENDRAKILWDFNIQTDHAIQHRRPGIVVLYKNERKCHLIDTAVPGDKRIELKEQEKIDNYTKLKQEVKKNLELISSCGCSSCNWNPRSDIKKIERLAGEVKHKELLQRA